MLSTLSVNLRVHNNVKEHYQYTEGCSIMFRNIFNKLRVCSNFEAHYQYN